MRTLLLVTASAAAFLLAQSAANAAIIETYELPGVTTSSVAGTSVETFNALSLGTNGFTTTYGTSGTTLIQGVYSTGAVIVAADEFGGVGGTHYVDDQSGPQNGSAGSPSDGYSITFTTGSAIPGVNYFGLFISAMDAGNTLEFFNGATLIQTYTEANLIAALGGCATSAQRAADHYCGNSQNSFSGVDNGENFAFVNFFDTTGFFTSIEVFENPHVGNYESDNHTVGYCPNIATCETGITVQNINTPEPVTLSLFGAGLAGAIAIRRRRKKTA